MGKSGKTIIKASKTDYTKVTFKPDLSKFGLTHLTTDMVDIMKKRVYDMAGCVKGVTVYLNGDRIPVRYMIDVLYEQVIFLFAHVYCALCPCGNFIFTC